MVRRTGIVNKVGGPMGPMGVLELAGEARRRHDFAGAPGPEGIIVTKVPRLLSPDFS